MSDAWLRLDEATQVTPIRGERRDTMSRNPVPRVQRTAQNSIHQPLYKKPTSQESYVDCRCTEYPNYSASQTSKNIQPDCFPRTYHIPEWEKNLAQSTSPLGNSPHAEETPAASGASSLLSNSIDNRDASLSDSEVLEDQLWEYDPSSEFESFSSWDEVKDSFRGKQVDKTTKYPSSSRPYTSRLGVPEFWHKEDQVEPSVISDAGDQLHKRQKEQPESESYVEPSPAQRFLARTDSIPQYNRHEFQEAIFSSLEETRNPGFPWIEKGFLPKAQLDRLVNVDSVAHELTRDLSDVFGQHHVRMLAEKICKEIEVVHNEKKKVKSFRKIFALLVITEHASSIQRFLDDDVSDLDLPLAVLKRKGVLELRRRDRLNKPSDIPLACFDHGSWSPAKLQLFEDYQWTMLAPFFSRGRDGDVKHYELMNKCILPFISTAEEEEDDDDDEEHHGGFARVFMVKIHKEHHNFHDEQLCKRGFAVKQLYEPNRELFRREVTMLKKFSGERSHKHVVSLLATYEHYKKFHLIFYRAQGDLFNLWKNIMPSPKLNASSVQWMGSQCAGIADGLLRLHRHLTMASYSRVDSTKDETCDAPVERRVTIVEPGNRTGSRDRSQDGTSRLSNLEPTEDASHQPPRQSGARPKQEEKYGRHGDINPGNILWFEDAATTSEDIWGTLKIADFGQAELNSLLSKSKKRSVANTLTYRPPECDVTPRIIRQSFDIWCLGCVYLEFISWTLGGWPLVSRFSRWRRAYDIFLKQETDTFFCWVRNEDDGAAEIMVKPAVTKFIEQLHERENCPEYFHEFLDMIQHNMLIIDSSQRISCELTWKRLKDMHARCLNDVTYGTVGKPWRPFHPNYPKPLMESVRVQMSAETEKIIEQNISSLPAHQGRPRSRAAMCAGGRL